jgi:hypothetical protein
MTVKRGLRVLLFAGLVGVFLATASAEARTLPLIGIQDDAVFVRLPSAYGGTGARRLISAQAGYHSARRLGASVIRVAINWAAVSHGPAATEQDWSHYDAAIVAARQRGFVVQIALTGPAPAFATANHRVGIDRPNARFFARFAEAAALRYRAQAQTYSIWNEPNWPSLLQPVRDAPAIYRGLYQAGYAAIKHADPQARVLIGELAPMGPPEAGIPPLRFLRELTCRTSDLRAARRCVPLIADGFALHPYTLRWQPTFPGNGPDDVTTGSLSRLVRILDHLARLHALSSPAGLPLDIYLTEYGWHANYRPIPEPLRALYATEGFTLALDHPRVKEIVWYQLAPPPPSSVHIWNTALLDGHGRPTSTFLALQDWIRRVRAIRRN